MNIIRRIIRKFNNIIFFLFLLCTAAVFLFPVYKTIASATSQDFLNLIITNINLPVLFPRYLVNSVIVTVLVTVLQLWLATPAGYALAKVRFPGAGFLNRLIEAGLLFGGAVLFVTQYIVLNELRLINTYPALILPMISTSLGVFLIREFARQIPGVLIDAARLDGASHRRICRDLIIPNIKPARVTLGIFAINSVWRAGSNNFVYSEELRVAADLTERFGAENAGVVAALAVILMAVPLAAFAIYRRSAAETLAYSGLK